MNPAPASTARVVLFVDDRATCRKWFASRFGGQFTIVTAGWAPARSDARRWNAPCTQAALAPVRETPEFLATAAKGWPH